MKCILDKMQGVYGKYVPDLWARSWDTLTDVAEQKPTAQARSLSL